MLISSMVNSILHSTKMWVYSTLWTLLLLWFLCRAEDLKQDIYINEELDIGTAVGTIGDGIPNVSPPFEYITFTSQGDKEDDWDIDKETGIIVVHQRIDRETKGDNYQFIAEMEQGRNVKVTIHVYDINDNAPTFSDDLKVFDFSESTPISAKTTIGSANDPDVGINSTQGYEILEGNSDDVFILNTKRVSNGQLYVELETTGELDYERTPFYSLLIRAHDGGTPQKFDFLRVNISIIDTNDNQPIFNTSRYYADVQENATIGTSVLQVFATDIDSGENGHVQYFIERQQTGDKQKEAFDIKSDTGILIVNKKLDYETDRVFDLIVVAIDNGTGQRLQTTAVATVTLTNVNDNPPEIEVFYLIEGNTGHIPESALPNDYIAKITVSDPDTDSTAQIDVTLSGGDDKFDLALSSNVVYLVIKSSPLDREMKTVYNLVITATDRGVPPLSSSKTLTLYISDTNDNAPVFEKTSYYAEIEEVEPLGTSVIEVKATDSDEGNNSMIFYELSSPPGIDWFHIDNRTGLITTKLLLDCEDNSEAILRVTATDSGMPPLSSTAEIVVHILNVNDNQPRFDESFYNVTVLESEPKGACFVQVIATDPDCEESTDLTYSFPSDLGLDDLEVKSDTGEVCIKSSLDHETRSTYDFTVAATDEGGLSSTTVVKVNVGDVNDNRPVFYPQRYTRTLRRGAQVNEEVVVVQATDSDSGEFGEVFYSIVSGNTRQLFDINENTGLIKLIGTFSHSDSSFALTVSARDGGDQKASALVDVSVADDAQERPTFTQQLYEFTVAEDEDIDETVGTVMATLAGSSTGITYNIESGDRDGYFRITSSGQIQVDRPLNHDTTSFVLLNIQAEAPGQIYGNAHVNVTITDVNDNTPMFALNPLTVPVREDFGVLDPIYTLYASDIDSGNNGIVTYTLATDSHFFRVDSISGELALKDSLDYETEKIHVITVTAKDKGSPQRTADVTVNIHVQDVNDNTPSFAQDIFYANVMESAAVNTKFAVINASDADSGNNARLTYRMTAGAYSSIFGIFPNDGCIYNKVELDRETQDSYTLEIVATDGGVPPRSSSTSVVITVLDVNDNSPIFVEDEYLFYIAENLEDSRVVGTLSAYDQDESDTVQYSLSAQSEYFDVVGSSGNILTKAALDREAIEVHEISIRAVDSGNPPRASEVKVTIQVLDENDNNPTFDRTGNYVVGVDENQAKGTEVVTVSASDPDNGENATLRFIFDDTNEEYVFENFYIHPSTGKITTKDILDYEKRSRYEIDVVVSDQGVLPLRAGTTVIVSVNDENESEPTFDDAHISLTIREDMPVHSTITHVKANDGDASDRVTYYIVGGNKFAAFLVNSTTGAIVIGRPVDYEESAHHSLQIRAVDSNPTNPKSSIINVNITIVDVNDNTPVFEHDPVIFSVQENVHNNTIVYTFSATDLDSGNFGQVQYEILSQSPNQPWFKIDKITGDLITVMSIDYENIKQISLVIKASDQPADVTQAHASTVTTLVEIEDRNDNSPVFQEMNQNSILEDEPVGYPVLNIIATDADSGLNGEISYIIVSGNDLGHFSLDSTTGLLTIARPLDRETIDVYKLNVSARDNGVPRRTSYALLDAHIADVNDNSPQFEKPLYEATVMENQNADTLITTIEATDRDIGAGALLKYLIPDGVLDNKFGLDSDTGQLRAKVSLDREQQEQYIITAYVRDNGFPALYDICTIVVTVGDENDNTPVFKESVSELEVPENTHMTSIYNMLALDADAGMNGKITYFITAGNEDGHFSIDQNIGKLSCVPLDREKNLSYNLSLRAQDGGSPPRSTSMDIYIKVLDDNDNEPVFKEMTYEFYLSEDDPVGTTVVQMEATDRDEGINSNILYSIDDNAGGLFAIDNTTGVINTTGLFDREQEDVYYFEVYATDGGLYGPRSQRIEVTIIITDVNDNSPVFEQIPYEAEIPQNTAPNTNVLTVSAKDLDIGANADVRYSLAESNDYFKISSADGVIRTKGTLQTKKYQFDIIAEDRGSKPRKTTGVVEITVGNAVPGDTPAFSKSHYNESIPEGAEYGSQVVTVFASVSSDLIPVTYSFASGNEDDKFHIGESNGKITVNDPDKLDFETKRELRLTVMAQAGSTKAYCTVWVYLKDVNDNAPRFSQDRYVSAVWEGNNKNTYVTQVSATDPDSGDNGRITYSIKSGAANGLNQPAFIFHDDTSIIKTNIILDREIVSSWRLEIEAIDSGQPPKTGTCLLKIQVVDVNDHEPFFPIYDPVPVKESTEPGTFVLQVTATDEDLDPVLKYDFASGGNYNNQFGIDPNSGKISVAKPLDYEVMRAYKLKVQVSDKNHTVSTEVILNVTDENDNPPVFTQQAYQVSINEDTGPGVEVTTVTATDQDDGENAEVRYSMISTHGFYINSLTGVIYTNQTVAYNPDHPSIDLVVTARDRGVPYLSAVEVVRVQVVDVNNNAPQFTQTLYSEEISEDEWPGYTVVQARAHDADTTHENSKVVYSIVAGNEHGMFQISSSTGDLLLIGSLDRETVPLYSLNIKASDRGHPPLDSQATVRVTVRDVNDNPPVFSPREYSMSVAEDKIKGEHVLQVKATDMDINENGKVQYRIASGNDDNNFEIDSDTGWIKLRTSLDHETHQIHRLTIIATDSSVMYPKQSAFATVIVNVSDVNEYGPRFPVIVYLEQVREKLDPGTYVFTAHANDDDSGEYGVISYELQDAQGAFVIDPNSGIITTGRELHYKTTSQYEFVVKASDKGGRFFKIHARVTVIPLFIPRFVKSEFKFTVKGNAKQGEEVGIIDVENADQSSSSSDISLSDLIGVVQFNFDAPNEYFAIGASSTGMFGIISVKKDLQSSDDSSRKRRSSERDHRFRRALTENEVVLTIIASVGYPETIQDMAVAKMSIDRTCEGCVVTTSSSSQSGGGLSGTPLILVIVFLLIAAILVVAIVVMFLRGREKWKNKRDNPAQFESSFNSSMDHVPPQGYGPPSYSDAAHMYPHHLPGQMIGSSMSEHSASMSSGRGSADMDIPEDEEIRMINATPLDHQELRLPDSGIQQDDDTVSERSAQNHQEYLARLGIDSSKLKGGTETKNMTASVESMHQFSDEGGGEGDGLEIGTIGFNQESAGSGGGGEEVAAPVLESSNQFNFHEQDQSTVGSLSSVINSEEEFSGSYNWDYLLDWGPQYQPLADVFTEIARLKDDSIKPKKVPTKIVSQSSNGFHTSQQQMRPMAFPPPIITDAPPRARTMMFSSSQQQNPSTNNHPVVRERRDSSSSNSNQTVNSARTSQLTSMASLPKSPMSYESSFTTTPLSPEFENSLSPLQHRSPSFSPIVTPKGLGSSSSGQNTPHNVLTHHHQNGILAHRPRRISGSNTIPVSSGSEQEFRI